MTTNTIPNYRETIHPEKLPMWLFIFLFVIFYFATWYDPFYTINAPSTPQEMDSLMTRGMLGKRIALLLLAGVGVFGFFFKKSGENKSFDILVIFIISFLAWSIISILWSDEKLLTLRKVFVLYSIWVGAVWIALKLSFREIQLFVLLSSLVTIFLGLIMEILLGTFHPLDIFYRFAGTFHPNTQGINCSLLAITGFSLFKTEQKARSLYFVAMISGLIFLFLTKSRTSYFTSFVVIFVYWIMISSNRQKRITVYTFIILCSLLGILYGQEILDFGQRALYVGRETSDVDTLSLRLPLWRECLDFIVDRPIGGYGYDTFWSSRHSSTISREQGWYVPHSHSGYIELTLGLGFIGLILYVGILLLGGIRAFLLYYTTKNCRFLYCLVMILWITIEMFTEIVNIHPFIANFICITIIVKLSYIGPQKFPIQSNYAA